MKSVILTSKSSESIELLLNMAAKLGVEIKLLTTKQLENAGLVSAIKAGRTVEFVDTNKFISSLK